MARTDPLNVAHYWQDRRTQGLSLMRADFRTQYYPPHRHDGFVIAATEYGGSVIKSRGTTEQASAAALLVFNPDEPHAGGVDRGNRWLFRSLYLEGAAIEDVVQGLGIRTAPYFLQNCFADAALAARFLALHRAMQERRDVLRESELLIGTFGTLFKRYGSGAGRIEPAPRDRARLTRAKDFVMARLGQALSLSDIAEALCLTQYQVISLFKRTTGLTPHAYITQLRLDAARRQLGRGDSIADVAVACGFYDQSALTNHFKRCYGLTPLQYVVAVRA
jgi:AraC-like DNA-binding protein